MDRDLLDEARRGGLGDDGGVGLGSGGLFRGWGVSEDGGDGLSGEPDVGSPGAVQHLVGFRVGESGVEETSGGEE